MSRSPLERLGTIIEQQEKKFPPLSIARHPETETFNLVNNMFNNSEAISIPRLRDGDQISNCRGKIRKKSSISFHPSSADEQLATRAAWEQSSTRQPETETFNLVNNMFNNSEAIDSSIPRLRDGDQIFPNFDPNEINYSSSYLNGEVYHNSNGRIEPVNEMFGNINTVRRMDSNRNLLSEIPPMSSLCSLSSSQMRDNTVIPQASESPLGRKSQLIRLLFSALQDTEIEYLQWVDDYSPEGGQSFSIRSDTPCIVGMLKLVSYKDDESKASQLEKMLQVNDTQGIKKKYYNLRKSLRNYSISCCNEGKKRKILDINGSQIDVFMFKCACPFHSNSNEDDIQKVIAMQTEKRSKKKTTNKCSTSNGDTDNSITNKPMDVQPHEDRLEYGCNSADITADNMAAHIASAIEENPMKVDCDKSPTLKVDNDKHMPMETRSDNSPPIEEYPMKPNGMKVAAEEYPALMEDTIMNQVLDEFCLMEGGSLMDIF